MSSVRRYVSRSEAGLCSDRDLITRHVHLEETRKKMLQLLSEKLHEIEKERASTRAMTESMIDLAKQCRIQEGQLRPKLLDQEKAIRMINKMLHEIQMERQISSEQIKSPAHQTQQGNVRDEKLRVKFQQQVQDHPSEAVPPGYFVPTDEEFHTALLLDQQKASDDSVYTLPEKSISIAIKTTQSYPATPRPGGTDGTPSLGLPPSPPLAFGSEGSPNSLRQVSPKTRPRRSTSALDYPKNLVRYSSPALIDPPLMGYSTRRDIPELPESIDDYCFGEDFQELHPNRYSLSKPPWHELCVLRKVSRKVPAGVYQQRRGLEPTEYRTGTEGLLGYDRASGRL